MKVWAILRESSESQIAKDRRGLGDQRAEITDFAAESGMEIAGWETVVESASRWSRPQWEKEMDELILRHHRGEIDGVVFHRIDRETRNVFSSIPILNRALESGIRVYFATDKLELDPRDPEVLDHYLDEATEARAYVKAVSKGWRRVHHRRARAGKHPTNQRLFSFRYDEDERVLDEGTVPIARAAIDLLLKNRLLSPVLQWLQGRGVSNFNSVTALRRWLQNPALKGETNACGEVIKHEGLISADIWDEVQAVLDVNRGRRPPRKGYLPIPFFCSCGGRMTAERHDTRVYIRCRQCQGKPYIRLDRFKDMLNLATMLYVQEKRFSFGEVEVKAEVRERVLRDLDEVGKAMKALDAKWEALLEQKMAWRGPKATLEKKEQALMFQQEALQERQSQLLDQLRQLPEIEVVDVQRAWEEAIRPYQVHFTPPYTPADIEQQNQTCPSEWYQPGPAPGEGIEIPASLSVQGDGVPSSWDGEVWEPPEQFKRIVPPALDEWVWDFWKSLRAEAVLDHGRVKVRFDLRVSTGRRANRTPSLSSSVKPTQLVPFEVNVEYLEHQVSK